MKRLLYTALAILVVIIAVLIAVASRETSNDITNDNLPTNISGDVMKVDLEKIFNKGESGKQNHCLIEALKGPVLMNK